MRILSGIQPSGKLHIGNFFGAMRQHLALQADHDGFYFIADYHAMTSNPAPAELATRTFEVAMDYLALGLDPKKTVFWRQSDVPEVTELAWILSCITPLGLLQRCTSYKDKVAQGLSPNHGLFAYPVLQAADILMFDSNLVPVGADQKQHIEVTRDIALKFNAQYGETFVVPEEQILKSVAVVPGLEVSAAPQPADGLPALHILGYFVDHRYGPLLEALERAAAARYEQKLAMVRRLQALGFDLPEEAVLERAGPGVLGRAHIADVAWERNPELLGEREAIFRDYIAPGGRAYVYRTYQISLAEACQLLRDAGGYPVLAHPAAYSGRHDIEAAARYAAGVGLAGIEGPYPYDGQNAGDVDGIVAHWVGVAGALGLAVTGGSDYHGERKGTALGAQGLTIEAFEALRSLWRP